MDLGEGVNKNSQISENRLVLSIDQNGKIVFFNKKCEKIAGYSKNEVVDKRILDFLVPDRDRERWEKIFNSVMQDRSIDSFDLPWLARNGREIMASWTIAPFDGSNSKMGNIGIVGVVQPTDDVEEPMFESSKNQIESERDHVDMVDKKDNAVLLRLGNKKIVFRKKPSSFKSERFFSPVTDNSYSTMDASDSKADKNVKSSKKRHVSDDKKTSGKEVKVEVEESPKDPKYIFNKYDHENLVKNYEKYNKTSQSFRDLEARNKQLEEENNTLKEDLKSISLELFNTRKKLEGFEKNQSVVAKKNKDLFKNSVNFIFDAAGGKKKQEEFDTVVSELEERRSVLSDLEVELNNEKVDLNNSRAEFVRWREKLESLEGEIEQRNMDLVNKEERVKKNLSFFRDEGVEGESGALKEESMDSVDVEELEHHEILDKIPQSAAIIQRGILKQVNDSFVEMLGYDLDKVLEKNLFDFVISEGFLGIEKYYLKRLKGETVTSYETMFHTMADDNIAVEVSTKPILFKGEKAEIAVFKKVGDVYDAADIGTSAVELGDNQLTDESSLPKADADALDDVEDSNMTSDEMEVDVDEPVVDSVDVADSDEVEDVNDTSEQEVKTEDNADVSKEGSKVEDESAEDVDDKSVDSSDEDEKSKYDIVKKLKNNEL